MKRMRRAGARGLRIENCKLRIANCGRQDYEQGKDDDWDYD
jgi:hypothetical protein